MDIKGIITRLKRIGYRHVLALAFLGHIFIVGLAAIPGVALAAIKPLFEARSITKETVTAAFSEMDEAYKSILNFKGMSAIRGSYINFNGLMARLMGQRYVNKSLMLDNGHLAELLGKQDTGSAAAQMEKLYNAQLRNGKEFLFALAPYQIPKYEDIIPAGYEDYSNENADQFLKDIEGKGIPFIDFREELVEKGISNDEAFFITDHHWTNETGFWAYGNIIDYFARNGIIASVDPMLTDIGSYDTKVYEDWFLGSAGKRTGKLFAGTDDFAVITPKFETEISLEIPTMDIFNKGVFSDVAFDWNALKSGYFGVYPDITYGYGNRPVKIYRNDNAPADLKVLTIRDSFAIPVSTFFPMVFKECREVDMRVFDEYGVDFESFYNEYAPDILIVLVNPNQLLDLNLTYDFFNDIEETS